MNIFSHLSNVLTGKSADDDAVELTAEEQAAQDKADRIAFHRTHVRNGPVNFKSVTAGQERRAQARALKRQMKKNFKREVSSYFERQQAAAVLRGHLQIVGVIPYFDGHEAPRDSQITSTAWINTRYGVEVVNDGVGTGHASFRRGDVVDAIRNAAKFYESATGYVLRVPADFEPAVYVVEDVA